MLCPLASTWSRPPKPISYAQPSPPIIQTPFLSKLAANSLWMSIESRKPSPNSALSSKRELDHAGPRPSAFVVHGVVGRLPPYIEEQPVALATIKRSPNNWLSSLI